MANDLITSNLPAHLSLLQNTDVANINSAAIQGISTGGHPRISIKSSRFRLQDVQGEEYVVPQTFLDVIIIDANPNISKTYYAGSYNPSETEPKAPDCFSDNGVGPSQYAEKPQCNTCNTCPHNVWGSKVNPNGSQTKACGDSRKLAVILAENPDGPIYELRVPAASLKNLVNFVKALDSKKVPVTSVVTRLEFDPNSDYPKLVFKPQSWISVEQASNVKEVLGSDETLQCTGKGDKAIAKVEPKLEAPKEVVATTGFCVSAGATMGAPKVEEPKLPKRTRKKAETTTAFNPEPHPQAALKQPVQQPKVVVNPPLADEALDAMIKSALNL